MITGISPTTSRQDNGAENIRPVFFILSVYIDSTNTGRVEREKEMKDWRKALHPLSDVVQVHVQQAPSAAKAQGAG
jgi:hypothetical protein